MFQVADYVVLSDRPLELGFGADIDHTFTFRVPKLTSDYNLRGPAILMMHVKGPKGLTWSVTINGFSVIRWEFDTDRFDTCIYELFPSGQLHSGNDDNHAEFRVLSGTGGLRFSDVVVWYQAEVQS